MFTEEELWKLRKQITLNSLYIVDYQNDFDINALDACDFFDGYVDYLAYMMEEDCVDIKTVDKFMLALERYDTSENLHDYYGCFEYDPLPIIREKGD